MRKLYHRLLAFAAVLPLAAGGTASASVDDGAQSEESAWAQTLAQGTFEAFTTFALAYPDSVYAGEVRTRLMKVKIPGTAAKNHGGIVGDDDGDARAQPSFIPDSIMVV